MSDRAQGPKVSIDELAKERLSIELVEGTNGIHFIAMEMQVRKGRLRKAILGLAALCTLLLGGRTWYVSQLGAATADVCDTNVQSNQFTRVDPRASDTGGP